jgi:uncharacterized protein
MRAVLDVNIIVSALLSRNGSPALVIRAWQEGRFELIVSPLLLAELERALAYPKLRRRLAADEAAAILEWLRTAATISLSPDGPPPMKSADPGDDYLLALAAAERAMLVSGDDHLLSLADRAPVCAPARFLELLAAGRS